LRKANNTIKVAIATAANTRSVWEKDPKSSTAEIQSISLKETLKDTKPTQKPNRSLKFSSLTYFVAEAPIRDPAEEPTRIIIAKKMSTFPFAACEKHA
jgi:hypothetical protein